MPEEIKTETAVGTTDAAAGKTTESATETKSETVGTETKKPDTGALEGRIIPSEYKLSLPKDSLLDQAKLAEVAEFAKTNKLTNEEAQAILERENATIAAYVDTARKQAEEAFKKTQEDWLKELKDDKEYGGENFPKSAELSKRVVDRYADDQFKKDLIDSGFGNHPGFNRFMAKIAKATSEDTFVPSGTPPAGGDRKPTANVLYPNQK